jgi:hypothetical protein
MAVGSDLLYDRIGAGYRDHRKADPRIFATIMGVLGDCQSVLNVGAGTGSYEPNDRHVVAVEPSETMIRQRRADAAPVVRAWATNLPFADGSFDAALALLTVHHWPDQKSGLLEMARVAGRCIVFTWDHSNAGMWLTQDYFPEIAERGKNICPPIDFYRDEFGQISIVKIPVPHDCTDGFLQAYWRRPEAYFDPGVRGAISAFAQVKNVELGLSRLRRDLDDGTWHKRYGHLLGEKELDLGYRLVVSTER